MDNYQFKYCIIEINKKQPILYTFDSNFYHRLIPLLNKILKFIDLYSKKYAELKRMPRYHFASEPLTHLYLKGSIFQI